MHSLALSALTRTARFAAETIMNRILKYLTAFIRRRLIGLWMAGMDVPANRSGLLREDRQLFLKNSAYHSLETFFQEKPRGATVFWMPERAGKTYTLSRMQTANAVDRRFVYVDFSNISSHDPKQAFYAQLGLDAGADHRPLSHYLPSHTFITFILDHFDVPMAVSTQNATAMISALAEDSAAGSSFNLLIMVNDSFHAHSLLTSCGQQLKREFTRLLGPPYCGRWSAADLGDRFSDDRYNDLVDQSGTLAPMISIRNGGTAADALTLIAVAKAEAEWNRGERRLAHYRVADV